MRSLAIALASSLARLLSCLCFLLVFVFVLGGTWGFDEMVMVDSKFSPADFAKLPTEDDRFNDSAYPIIVRFKLDEYVVQQWFV